MFKRVRQTNSGSLEEGTK